MICGHRLERRPAGIWFCTECGAGYREKRAFVRAPEYDIKKEKPQPVASVRA